MRSSNQNQPDPALNVSHHDRSRLRQALRKLREIPFSRDDLSNVATAPQEMLDFLVMLAGLKPVFLLGRGFDDLSWIEGVSAVASEINLNVLTGPRWQAENGNIGLPDWYDEVAPKNQKDDQPVVYISKLRSIATQVRDICSSGIITMEQEASKLGYPLCCVQHHYIRIRAMNSGFNLMLQRYSKGDIEEMKRLVREKVGMIPETPQEISNFSLVSNSQLVL